MYTLRVTTAKGTEVDNIHWVTDSCLIGKSVDNLVVLHGWSVAPKHASLHVTDEGVFIHDQGAKSGTSVNGDKIDRYGPLTQSDEIAIGSYRIRVVASRSEDSELERMQDSIIDLPPKSKAQAETTNKTATKKAPVAKQEPTVGATSKTTRGVDSAPTSAPATELAPTQPAYSEPQDIEQVQTMLMLRGEIQQRLLKVMDLRRVDVSTMGDEELRSHTKALIDEIVSDLGDIPKDIDKEQLAKEALDEAVGLGPLEELLADESITEVMVNRFDEIFYERAGKLYKSTVTFSGHNSVAGAIERIVAPLGRRIDEGSPMVDARLKDGSRVNAMIPPLALKGPNITIRKFSKNRLTSDDLMGFDAVSEDMVKFLQTAVKYRRNTVVSGGTGSGKTTLLNVLSNFIPDNERIVTVEDAAELRLNQPNLVSLEARPANQEGKGQVTIRDLVKNCLRMRPDRIIVGECRGAEALDMLQAMNTGHDGSLTTAHANSPRDCISRLEVMVLMAGMELPVIAIREQIASAVNIIVQQSRFACGTRKITSICEVTGVESGTVQLAEIFKYKQEGYDADGKVKGRFMATGLIPEFYSQLREAGLDLDLSIFGAAD